MNGWLRASFLTILAVSSFAANSVLCRLALGGASIDAASFSNIRLVSGAAALWLVMKIYRKKHVSGHRGNWISGLMLFLYAISFSFAYISLSTGTGALLLFGTVQATMILAGLRSGERPHVLQWIGLFTALGGLTYLVFPGLTAPSVTGSVLMCVAGVAWGVYSLRGRGVLDPIAVTTDNFVRTIPFVLVVGLITLPKINLSQGGIFLAFFSGAMTSGMGYVFWYAALRRLTATRAAVVQLCVPILAALGGVIFLSEAISMRLTISSILTLTGVALAMLTREYSVH